MKTKLLSNLKWLVIAASLTLVSTSARADQDAKKTPVNLQEPTRIPGAVLQPGNYWFEIAGAKSGWNIVRVYNQDGTSLVTTLLAYPNPKISGEGQRVLFYPRSVGSTKAMEAYVDNQSTTEQLAYPKDAADKIGSVNRERIPTTGTEDVYPSSLPLAEKSWSAPINPDAQSPTDNQIAQNNSDSARPARTMPRTASNVPLIALLGVLSLLGIVAIRRLS